MYWKIGITFMKHCTGEECEFERNIVQLVTHSFQWSDGKCGILKNGYLLSLGNYPMVLFTIWK